MRVGADGWGWVGGIAHPTGYRPQIPGQPLSSSKDTPILGLGPHLDPLLNTGPLWSQVQEP